MKEQHESSPQTQEMQKLLEKRPLRRKIPNKGWYDTIDIPRYANVQIWVYYDDITAWLREFLPKLEAFCADHVSREEVRKLIEEFPEIEYIGRAGYYNKSEIEDWKKRLELLTKK